MKFRPNLENLECRITPSTWGNPWPEGANLTLSFAPDGTQIGQYQSDLHDSLNADAPTAEWQTEILRAFQTWAVHANLNIGVVADGGQQFGADGRLQGDARFGDIRVAGYDMNSLWLGHANPFESLSGTHSGDFLINTGYSFADGEGNPDLFAVAVHEAAHVFGLGHSDDHESAVFASYHDFVALTAEDISRLQELYGARQHDQFEGSAGNETIATATYLGWLKNSDGSLGVQADGDLTTLDDVDFYRIQAPISTGSFSVHLRTEGLSLLSAKITVFDVHGNEIGSQSANGDGDLTVNVSNWIPGKTYYVKVESTVDDVFGIGSYRLESKSAPVFSYLSRLLGQTTDSAKELLNDDLHTDDSMLTASLIPPLFTKTSSQFDYAFNASIRDSWDVDYYRVNAAGLGDTLTVMAWGTDDPALLPRVSVFDASGRNMNAQVLVNQAGNFVVQVTDIQPGADYFVKVEAKNPKGDQNTGNYFLGVDFDSTAETLETHAEGQLSYFSKKHETTFSVDRNDIYHFVLSATTNTGNANLVMTISDAQGDIVARMATGANADAVSYKVTLAQGDYTIRFSASRLGWRQKMNYLLQGVRLGDRNGPGPDDPTEDPSTGYSYSPPPQETQTNETPPASAPPPQETQSNETPPAPPPEETESGTTTSSPNSSSEMPPEPADPPPPQPEEDPGTSDPYWQSYEADNRGLEEEDPYSDPYSTF